MQKSLMTSSQATFVRPYGFVGPRGQTSTKSADWDKNGRTRDGNHVWETGCVAVHSGRRREHDGLYASIIHRLQQIHRPANVHAIIF